MIADCVDEECLMWMSRKGDRLHELFSMFAMLSKLENCVKHYGLLQYSN